MSEQRGRKLEWRTTRREDPCEVCGSWGWCSYALDEGGDFARFRCERVASANVNTAGFRELQDGTFVYDDVEDDDVEDDGEASR